MAFERENFARQSTCGTNAAPVLWTYRSEDDDKSDIDDAGYFDDVARELTEGDIIFIHGDDGAQVVYVSDITLTNANQVTVASMDTTVA